MRRVSGVTTNGRRQHRCRLIASTAVFAALQSAPALAVDIVVTGAETTPQIVNGIGDTVKVTSTGSISATGGNYAIQLLDAVDQAATIAGTVSLADNAADGVFSTGDNHRIKVLGGGIINTTRFGIHAQGDNAWIENNGSVYGEVAGVRIAGDNVVIVNSGRITGPDFADVGLDVGGAILLRNDGTTSISLLAGSILDGRLLISEASDTTLKIGPGLNTYLSIFNQYSPVLGTAEKALPQEILTNSPYMIYDENVVVAIDPSRFAIADEMLTDLTGSIADAVDTRLTAARRCHVSGGGGADLPENFAVAFSDPDANVCGHQQAMWATAFGAYRDQDATDSIVGFDHWIGGIMAGADRAISATMLAGLYGGYAHGEAEFDANVYDIKTDSAFVGAYWSNAPGAYFLDLGLVAGYTWYDHERTVANNTIEGGLETASSTHDAYFISPTATLGTDIAVGDAVLTPSTRFRYAFLHLDGHDEDGSMANMSVDSRNVHVVELRAQLALARDFAFDGGVWNAGFHGGVDGIFNWGENVSLDILGETLTFAAGDDDSVARGFLGADASFTSEGGTVFGAGVEVGYDTAEALSVEARANLSVPF